MQDAILATSHLLRQSGPHLGRAPGLHASGHQHISINRQIKAAALRLIRELALYLLCVGPEATDPNRVFRGQRIRDIASATLPGWAPDPVEYLEWDPLLVDEAHADVEAQPENAPRTVLPGSALDAAIPDPRWSAGGTVRALARVQGSGR